MFRIRGMSDPVSGPIQPHKSPIALELRGITKRYPLVLANDRISLDLRWGEVLAIVGENGAGKSTLMKIVYGLVKPDAGEIWINGQKVEVKGPTDAIVRGVGMVHQHFMLVDPFTVLENVILGSEPRSGGQINLAQARVEVSALMKELEFELELEAKIEDLPVGLQQRVEILKALYRHAKILILDEPTAVLTPQEAEDLFRFLRKFVAAGGAVIFITHKLGEVIQVSDRVTVIRDGRVVGTVNTEDTNVRELARMMVGREVILTVGKGEARPKEVVLEVKDLVVDAKNPKHSIKNMGFRVRSGEIVGIAGVEGNGQSELVEAITGLRPYKGTILYGGTPLPPKARVVREWGLSHIPEDRNGGAWCSTSPPARTSSWAITTASPTPVFWGLLTRRPWKSTPRPWWKLSTYGPAAPISRPGATPAETPRNSSWGASFPANPRSSWRLSPPAGWTSGPSSSSTRTSWRPAMGAWGYSWSRRI